MWVPGGIALPACQESFLIFCEYCSMSAYRKGAVLLVVFHSMPFVRLMSPTWTTPSVFWLFFLSLFFIMLFSLYFFLYLAASSCVVFLLNLRVPLNHPSCHIRPCFIRPWLVLNYKPVSLFLLILGLPLNPPASSSLWFQCLWHHCSF